MLSRAKGAPLRNTAPAMVIPSKNRTTKKGASARLGPTNILIITSACMVKRYG